MNRFTLNRRSFLRTAAPFALGLPALARAQTFVEKGRWSDRYTDGSNGDYDFRPGKFRVKVSLSKSEPGIYTVVFWVRRVPTDKGFPAAQVCILSQNS